MCWKLCIIHGCLYLHEVRETITFSSFLVFFLGGGLLSYCVYTVAMVGLHVEGGWIWKEDAHTCNPPPPQPPKWSFSPPKIISEFNSSDRTAVIECIVKSIILIMLFCDCTCVMLPACSRNRRMTNFFGWFYNNTSPNTALALQGIGCGFDVVDCLCGYSYFWHL